MDKHWKNRNRKEAKDKATHSFSMSPRFCHHSAVHEVFSYNEPGRDIRLVLGCGNPPPRPTPFHSPAPLHTSAAAHTKHRGEHINAHTNTSEDKKTGFCSIRAPPVASRFAVRPCFGSSPLLDPLCSAVLQPFLSYLTGPLPNLNRKQISFRHTFKAKTSTTKSGGGGLRKRAGAWVTRALIATSRE